MNVLIDFFSGFESTACIALDILKRHIANDDNVYVTYCNKSVKFCVCRGIKKNQDCAYCDFLIEKSLGEFSKKVQYVPFKNERNENICELFNSVAELKKYTINGVNIGMPTASLIITSKYDDDFDTHKERDNINACLNDAWYSYESTVDILKKIKIHKMYIYNGRFPFEAGMAAACSAVGVPFETYDCIGTTETEHRYTLSRNLPVCSMIEHTRHCNAHYATLDEDVARKRAMRWLQNRLEHNDFNMFAERQKFGHLPENFSENKINIAYFNSSSFEYAAVPEFKRIFGPYTSEEEMLSKIGESLLQYENIHFYARMHPNLKHYKNERKKEKIFNVGKKYENLTIIGPTDPVDTYELIKKADIVLVTISMVGFESALLGKPVIVLGDSIHKNLGGFYTPQTHEDLLALLVSPPEPLEPIGAIKTINYWIYGGTYAEKHDLSMPLGERISGRLKQLLRTGDCKNFFQCFYGDMKNCVSRFRYKKLKRRIARNIAQKQAMQAG